jgi:hypothetical protein
VQVWPDVVKLELYNQIDLPKNQVRKVKERLRYYIKVSQTFSKYPSAWA